MKKVALISVSDKKDIDILASKLIKNNYTLLSTGGTAKFLQSKGINIIPISQFTNFDEILGGRVKTLHPVIHAGILAKTEKDLNDLKDDKYHLIDMVIVNLYPFEKTIAEKNCTFSKAIENIDIGGPTLLRASAKNHERVIVLTEPEDYQRVINEIEENGSITKTMNRELAAKAFLKVSKYDSMIANYLTDNKNNTNLLTNNINMVSNELEELRYGENPHQNAKLYEVSSPELAAFDYIQLSGKQISFNNLVDTESAYSCVEQFKEPTCVIVKHANPCGVATATSLDDAYKRAYKTDPTSAFGGIIAFNRKISSALIKKIINKQFVEVIVAPAFDNKASEVIKAKPNVRLLQINLKKNDSIYEAKLLRNKLLVQERDDKKLSRKNST